MVRKEAQDIHTDYNKDKKTKYEDFKNVYIELLTRCIKFSDEYLDILDIKYIFNIYEVKRIVFNMSDNVKIWDIPDINNEQSMKDDLQKFVNLKKEKYFKNVIWSEKQILKNLNEIEVTPYTFSNGNTETKRVAEWMYRNKTKIVHEIINKEFDDAYELLNGMLKSEYTKLIGYMRAWYDLNENL
ncbi:hypothetical protein [Staphylococcus aureus]|uniref:hypothetical protein n=1 Tax=Staphylococcus aureus TaxID=1280 RepID=UPI001E5A3D1E|nr:hypothetical protein [Staphylococcus aureus]